MPTVAVWLACVERNFCKTHKHGQAQKAHRFSEHLMLHCDWELLCGRMEAAEIPIFDAPAWLNEERRIGHKRLTSDTWQFWNDLSIRGARGQIVGRALLEIPGQVCNDMMRLDTVEKRFWSRTCPGLTQCGRLRSSLVVFKILDMVTFSSFAGGALPAYENRFMPTCWTQDGRRPVQRLPRNDVCLATSECANALLSRAECIK